MIQLYNGGVYLVNGAELVTDPSALPGKTGRAVTPEEGRKGTIAVNDDMESSVPMLFAGGDIVRGGATVILAMGDGRHAAATMHAKIMGEG